MMVGKRRYVGSARGEDQRAAFTELRDEAQLLRGEYAFVVEECRAGNITRAEEAVLLTAIVSRMRVVYHEMRALVPPLSHPAPPIPN